MVKKPLILGTGLSGLVGSRIVELLGDKYDFVDFSLDTKVSILDKKALKDNFAKYPLAKVVLHLAAFTDTKVAWEQRGDKKGLCYLLNVEGTENVLNLCQEQGKHLIHFSTDFVFDGKKEGAYTEDNILSPIEWYGETKYQAEKLISSRELKASILRIAFPFRAYFSPKKDVLRGILEGLEGKSLYPMFVDQITTPTFIDDIALGVGQFITSKQAGVFHLVSSSYQSPYEMAKIVSEVFGYDPSLVQKGSLEKYLEGQLPNSRPWQRNLALDNSKVRKMGIIMRSLKESLLEIKRQKESK